jgi:hypothetical protein
MKTRLFCLAFLCFTSRAFAIFGVGDIVWDPTIYGFHVVHETKELAHWAEEIKRYEDMILNARSLLNVQNTVKEQLGDWQGVYDRAKMIETSVDKLIKNPGVTFENVVGIDYGQNGSYRSLNYNNRGNYSALVTKDAFGANVTIQPQAVRRYAVVENAYDNFATVYKETEPDIAAAQKELGETYEEMSKPGVTQATYSKLSGKAQALQTRVAQLSQQRREASEMLAAQQTLNANQAKKEAEVNRTVQESNHQAVVSALTAVAYGPLKWR